MINNTINLDSISEGELLALRISELPIAIEGTWLTPCITQLYQELEAKLVQFKPRCYLADEWFTPDGEPIIAIPFYLAHPTLMKLEEKMMFEVEGGTVEWCMKLLRHEAGHAINYAYKLFRRKKWREIFGEFKAEYPDRYRFRPYSKNFVRHLENYYAQYHPDEDFAETFAVWLDPSSRWDAEYHGWGALHKLHYVDMLMKRVGPSIPFVTKGKKYWDAKTRRITLRQYYKKRKIFNAEDFPDFHDANLHRIFAPCQHGEITLPHAARTITRYRPIIMQSVSQWTGERKYLINELLQTITDRCHALKLRAPLDDSITVIRVATYVATLIMNYRYTGTFKGKT